LKKRDVKLASGELFEFAVKALSRRAQSTAELRAKLRLRAAEESSIEEVIARLKEYGYLDDRRFAESFATARLENERFGKARTLNDLRARRVAGPVANAAVDETYRETDELKLIEEYIRKKYRSANRETLFQEDKDLAAAYRRLLRAGFRSGSVVRVLKRFAKNPELLDAIEPEDPVEEA
jgi:regulatory protein